MIPRTITMALFAMGLAGCSAAGLSGATPGGNGGATANGNAGATGAAPERYMGERPNVNGTWNGSTSSSSMLSQRIKQDSANGATSGGASTRY